MRCIPDECPHCIAWGPTVPGKVRCERNLTPPPKPNRHHDIGSGWFSTTLGAPCLFEDESTPRLF